MSPLRVAVVGAGPAGLYAAGHLLAPKEGTYLRGRLRQIVTREIEVDLYDRLPVLGGLVRYGVAPDHGEKKLVLDSLGRILDNPRFRFFGGVRVGTDVRTEELLDWYDAVIIAVGASGDSVPGIPGATLPGAFAAREFIAWYNAHPDSAELPVRFDSERVVIVGNGNVAMDVARVLSLPTDVLRATDIAGHALDALAGSKLREVRVLGRRGAADGAFNNPELEELGELPGVDVTCTGFENTGDDGQFGTDRKLATLADYAGRPSTDAERKIVLSFCASPVEILGSDRVEGVRIERNDLVKDPSTGRVEAVGSGEFEEVPAGMVIFATGYFGTPVEGLPFDESRGVIPNDEGSVVGVPGGYVTGWIKRGPRGIIGTNKKCSRDTAIRLLADADAGLLPTGGTLGADEVRARVRDRVPEVVELDAWRRIEASELERGKAAGRSRDKFARVDDMLAAAGVQ